MFYRSDFAAKSSIAIVRSCRCMYVYVYVFLFYLQMVDINRREVDITKSYVEYA